MKLSTIEKKKIYLTSMLKTIDDIKNVYSQKYYNMTHQSKTKIKQLHNMTTQKYIKKKQKKKKTKKKKFNTNIRYDYYDSQPKGLWYAKHFCRFIEGLDSLTYDKIQDEEYLKDIDSDNIQGKYMYGIKIKTKKIYTDIDHPNPNLILRLRNNQDNLKFIKKYGKLSTYITDNRKYDYNWKKIAKNFAGIEIDNENSPVFYTWKCYGCIWNTDIIADLKLLAKKRDKKKYSPWEVLAPK